MAKYKVALDAGHGINTSGKRTPALTQSLIMDGKTYKTGETIREREFNQRIMKLVEKELDRISDIEYIECVGAITEDTTLANRVKKANNSKADLFVSIHANALTSAWQEKAYGLVSIHTQNSSTKAKTLAKNCYNYLSKDVKWYSNGATKYGVRTDIDLTGSTYYVLRNTSMPAVLLELGFMDSINDVKVMITDEFAKNCAKAIAKGICDTLSVKYVEEAQNGNESVSAPSGETTYYRVIAGSYTDRKNAENMKEQLAKLGIPSFLEAFKK